ncbi:hypothetical protein ABPG75_003913 [Micractinium tetrahymenae]
MPTATSRRLPLKLANLSGIGSSDAQITTLLPEPVSAACKPGSMARRAGGRRALWLGLAAGSACLHAITIGMLALMFSGRIRPACEHGELAGAAASAGGRRQLLAAPLDLTGVVTVTTLPGNKKRLTIVADELVVAKQLRAQGSVAIQGATALASTLVVNDDATFKRGFKNSLFPGATGGDLKLRSLNVASLTVGAATVSGRLQAGSAAVVGALTAGSATVAAALRAGAANVTGALAAQAAAVQGQLTAGSAILQGALTAASATIDGQLSASSLSALSAGISGALTAQSGTIDALTAGGSILADSLTANLVTANTQLTAGAAVISGDLQASNITATSGVLAAQSANITGQLSAGSIALTGALTAQSGSFSGEVAAAAVTAENVTASGHLEAGSAAVGGGLTASTATIAGQLAAGSADITSSLTASNITASDQLAANSASIAALLAAGSASISGDLAAANANISNNATAARLVASASLQAQAASITAGLTAGSLTVSGAVTVASNLTVTGSLTTIFLEVTNTSLFFTSVRGRIPRSPDLVPDAIYSWGSIFALNGNGGTMSFTKVQPGCVFTQSFNVDSSPSTRSCNLGMNATLTLRRPRF